MTQVLSLYTGSTLILNMLTGDARVRSAGWSPQIGGMEDGTVWDTFDLVGKAANNTAYLDALYAIQKFCTDAREYRLNSSREDPCWLHYQAEGGVEVRALVYDGNVEVPGSSKYGALLNNAGAGVARLALQRSAWFEATSSTTVTNGSLSAFAGMWTPTVTAGNLPGRIKSLKVSGYAGTTLDDLWVGVKPTYEGTGSFNALWQAESGTLGADTTTAADATASGGNRITISFATTPTMAERLRISVSQILGSNYTHMIGSYLVLARMKTTAGVGRDTPFLIRTYQGLLGGTLEWTGELAYYTPPGAVYTNWSLFELGYFTVPSTGYRFSEGGSAALWCSSSTFYIYAQRLSGSASLYIDCLILIPIEPLLTVKTCGLNAAADYAQFHASAIGDTTTVVYDSATTSYSLREHGAGLQPLWPVDGGILVYAAQATYNSTLGHFGALEIIYYPRYSLLTTSP